MFKTFTGMLLAVSSTAGVAQDRWFQPQHAELGRPLYQQHCAACHGVRGEGAPRWQQRNPDGSFPAPPLNGTGHAWHHPLRALHNTIANGQGNMPGWRQTLDSGEILAVIAWFQSQWPDEIYAAWQRLDRDSRAGGG